MRQAEDIKRLIKKLNDKTSAQMDKRVLGDVLRALEESEQPSALTWPNIRRTIMKSPITKLAAAAVIITAVVLSITLWDRSTPLAYGIEQTIEANNSVRYLHIKNFTAGEDEPREGWLEFDQDGQVTKVRAHMPEWLSPMDESMVIVWKGDVEQVWNKRKKVLATMKAKDNTKEQLTAFLKKVDPKTAVKHIYELQSQGKVKVEINEPTDKAEPITMTVTYLPESSTPDKRKVLYIDPTTKLVNTIELYKLKDDEYQYEGMIELDDYNQPIDAQLFDLQNEVPPDVKHFDQTANDVGLSQGQLSDEQAATEVVRQFFQALIAEDYTRAGKLFVLTMPANQLQQHIGRVKILRIVSIGPAVLNPKLETKGFDVPCKIELEENGKRNTPTLEGIKVQQLRNQPERWGIFSLSN